MKQVYMFKQEDPTMNHRRSPTALLQKMPLALALAAACVLGSGTALADPINLVQNGGFELTAGAGQIGYNTTVDGWNTVGYNFVFNAGGGDTAGAVSWYNAPLTLWGSNNGGVNPLAASGNGGNFVGADGSYGVAPIQQLITGLMPERIVDLFKTVKVEITQRQNFSAAPALRYRLTQAIMQQAPIRESG